MTCEMLKISNSVQQGLEYFNISREYGRELSAMFEDRWQVRGHQGYIRSVLMCMLSLQ
jgi:hypothetical protein